MTKKKQLGINLEQSLLAEQTKFHKAEEYFAQAKRPREEISIREKVVREGISLPLAEAQLIKQLKNQISEADFYPSKSEILRAGLISLSQKSKEEIKELIKRLTMVKKGR